MMVASAGAVSRSSVLTASAPNLGTKVQKTQVVLLRHCSLGWKQPLLPYLSLQPQLVLNHMLFPNIEAF